MNKGMTLTWTCSLPELTLSSFFFSSLVSWWFSTCSTVASQYWAGQVLKNLDFGKVGSRLDKPGTSGKRRDRSGWPRCASRTREGRDQLWIQTGSLPFLIHWQRSFDYFPFLLQIPLRTSQQRPLVRCCEGGLHNICQVWVSHNLFLSLRTL